MLGGFFPAIVRERLVRDPDALLFAGRLDGDYALMAVRHHGAAGEVERSLEVGATGPSIGAFISQRLQPVLEAIHATGGDVIRFGPTTLLAAWKVEAATGVSEALGLALYAALAAVTTPPGRDLAAVVSAGEASIIHVGGELDRWEFVVAGEPVNEVMALVEHARPGEVLIAPRLSGSLPAGVRVAPAETTPALRVVEAPVAEPRVAVQDSGANLDAETALRFYIPGAVRCRLESGMDVWIAEVLPVALLLVGLPGLDHGMELRVAQPLVRRLQRAIYAEEGSVSRLFVGERGLLLLAAFGLPPMQHGDDPLRATRAAVDIVEAMEQRGAACHAAVAGGRAFCGVVGDSRRHDYVVMGKVIHDVERLLSRATQESPGVVWADELTASAWRAELSPDQLARLRSLAVDPP